MTDQRAALIEMAAMRIRAELVELVTEARRYKIEDGQNPLRDHDILDHLEQAAKELDYFVPM